jgi:hypothetical protein
MERLKDLWLEIRIEAARRKFIAAQVAKSSESYRLMHKYYWLCDQRKTSQVRRMEERFM